MNFVKITPGFVRQTFNDAGECIDQEFVAGDSIEYETTDGDPLDSTQVQYHYHPFDMVNPLDQ